MSRDSNENVLLRMEALYPKGFALQQTMPSRFEASKAFFADKNIQVMDWPAVSPVLSN